MFLSTRICLGLSLSSSGSANILVIFACLVIVKKEGPWNWALSSSQWEIWLGALGMSWGRGVGTHFGTESTWLPEWGLYCGISSWGLKTLDSNINCLISLEKSCQRLVFLLWSEGRCQLPVLAGCVCKGLGYGRGWWRKAGGYSWSTVRACPGPLRLTGCPPLQPS